MLWDKIEESDMVGSCYDQAQDIWFEQSATELQPDNHQSPHSSTPCTAQVGGTEPAAM